jgi:hypothetical protein
MAWVGGHKKGVGSVGGEVIKRGCGVGGEVLRRGGGMGGGVLGEG